MTIVAPAGRSKKKEKVIPNKTDISATRVLNVMAVLKPLANCKAVVAGKINKAETNITPTTLTDSTTVTAVSKASKVLIEFVLMPVVLAYSSSKVAEKISQ